MANLNVREEMNKYNMRYLVVQRGDKQDFVIAVFWLEYDAEQMRRKSEFGKKNEHYYIYDRVNRKTINVTI